MAPAQLKYDLSSEVTIENSKVEWFLTLTPLFQLNYDLGPHKVITGWTEAKLSIYD